MRKEADIVPFTPSTLPEGPWIVLAPHPDDETFGMGGSILKAAKKGIEIFVVFITSGEVQGDPRAREEEAEAALKVLGVPKENLFFLRMGDRQLDKKTTELSYALREFLKRFSYGTVFAPSPMEYNPDHRVVSRIAYMIAKEAGLSVMFYEVLREGEVNVLIPISDSEMELKRKAMHCYKSQLKFGYLTIVESLNRLRSVSLQDANYAEGFYDCSAGLAPAFIEYWKDIPHPIKFPPVSVVTRTKNRPLQLEEALGSLALQDFPEMEVIVVNDGGEDVSSIVKRFENKIPSIQHIKLEESRGRAAAANTGLDKAEGTLILFLDDDDLLEPNAIRLLVEEWKEDLLLYGKSKAMDIETASVIREYGQPFHREKLLFENYIPTGSYVVKADVAKEIKFDESFEVLEDWDFLIRLSLCGDFRFVPIPVLIHRTGRFSFLRISQTKREWWQRIYQKHIELYTPEVLTRIFDAKMTEILRLEDKIKEIEKNYLAAQNRIEELELLNKEIEKKRREVEELRKEIDKYKHLEGLLESEVELYKKKLAAVEGEILEIKNSLAWKLIMGYRKVVHGYIFPEGTKRRYVYDLCIRGVKNLLEYGFSDTAKKTKRFLSRISTEKGEMCAPETYKDRIPLKFQITENPEASIIIPMFNKSDLTYNCLRSILENTNGVDYEVIVVDDSSTEDISWLKSMVTGIRIISNEQNLGFVGSCNRGAHHAKGKYLVFLNNDTLVTESWLQEMLKVFSCLDNVGIVGARLVFPDGKLQEAGGIIWKDGSGWNYGRMDNPKKPEYSYLREVDYCSGACICISKKTFEELGGFDEVFSPAYYEDTDLAFKVRSAGMKVVYNPFAIVFHLEGATAGRDTSQGIKRYQEVNRQKFLAKWKNFLDKHHFPFSEDLLFLARERPKKGVILVADHYVPMWDKDSGSYRMYNILKILSELGYKVIFWPDNLADLQPYTRKLQEMGIEVIYGAEYSFEKYLREYGKFINLVWACRANFAPKYLAEAKKQGIRTIYDTIDLHYLREMRRAEIEGSERLKKKALELKEVELTWARNSDKVLVVSHVEREILEKEGISNVVVIPNIHTVVDDIPGFDRREGIMFIGSFEHPPNEDAVVWFVKEIFPLVRSALGNVKFYIVGNSPTKAVKSLENEHIIVTGYVPDVDPYFKNSRVFVSPLRYGAGLKGKIGQAMAYGLPVVTTSIGAEGFICSPEPFKIADTPSEFAHWVVQLYKDRNLWAKYSELGRECIRSHFSYSVVKEKIQDTIDDLAIKSPWNEFIE